MVSRQTLKLLEYQPGKHQPWAAELGTPGGEGPEGTSIVPKAKNKDADYWHTPVILSLGVDTGRPGTQDHLWHHKSEVCLSFIKSYLKKQACKPRSQKSKRKRKKKNHEPYGYVIQYPDSIQEVFPTWTFMVGKLRTRGFHILMSAEPREEPEEWYHVFTKQVKPHLCSCLWEGAGKAACGSQWPVGTQDS